MDTWLASCFDEIEKIAKLTREEERNQALQFAALGAGSMPVASALSNIIERGTPLGAAKSFPRWLGARAVTGGMIFGALPAARHALERSNVAKSKKRKELSQQLNQIATEAGVRPPALAAPEPKVAQVQSSWMKPPSKKSLEEPMKRLREHQQNAKPPKPKMTPVFPNTGGVDVMPKLGGVMDLSKDPLIQYLQKHGSKTPLPPMKVPTTAGGEIPDNRSEMETGKEEAAMASNSPMPGKKMEAKVDDQWRSYLKEKFENTSGISDKYTENDFNPAVGSVDKTLKANKT